MQTSQLTSLRYQGMGFLTGWSIFNEATTVTRISGSGSTMDRVEERNQRKSTDNQATAFIEKERCTLRLARGKFGLNCLR
eukprot:1143355-Pelagomonas_calceolata.AAC.1